MSVRSAQSITVVFTTRRFDTGAATNADSLPAGTLYVNGTADAASVTVTNITTGVYKAAVTLPTLAVNDVVDLRIAATVNSVADNAVVWRDTKDMFAGVLPDVVAGGSGGLLISGTNTGTTTIGALTVSGATTLTGAVSLGSTLTVTGTTTLTGAVSLGSNLSITGTVSAGVFTVTGAMTVNSFVISTTLSVGTTTTFTGAITASNASNNIVGIDVAKLSGDATAADNAEAFFDGTGYAGTNNVIPTVTSVTGAVGSVAGNVGGNVVGSVASVVAAVATTSNVKKNQALSSFEFMMTDSTNHAPATGKIVTVTRSIDGGAFASGTLGSVAEVSNGIYKVDFGSGDLNGNVITLRATAMGCDDTFERIVTQP